MFQIKIKTLQVWQKNVSQRPPHKERAVLSTLCGSMTVEAAMVLPIFLFAICNIIQFFVLMNFQNLLQMDMDNSVRQLSCVAYMEGEESKISESYAKMLILSGKAGEKAADVGIIGGKYGICFIRSELSPNSEINSVVADYIWKRSGISIPFVQKSSYIPWIGKSFLEDESSDSDQYVYITQKGTVYHTSQNCTYLTRCIKSVLYSKVEEIRNISGGKYKCCERCIGEQALESNHVYITDYGDRYHRTKECSTLKRYIIKVKLSQVSGKKQCIKCLQKEEEKE